MNDPARRMTFAEYLAFESEADVRHEFLNGEVFAMAGGSPEHAAIAGNVIRHLGNVLRIASVREYLVISQTERYVEHHVRREHGAWVLTDVRGQASVTLASLARELPLAEIYLKVAV